MTGSDKIGFTAPSVQGQTKVIRAAHENAQIQPESIGYVEAHGTATKLGDPIEIQALTQAFQTDQKKFCAIGAVKSNIGHLNIAAGVASFIKVVLALKNRLIPPSLHFQSPNPEIDFNNSPFYVNTKLEEWFCNGYPRRAGVSAFGFGGTNAHLVLEEAPQTSPSQKAKSKHLLILSAKTETALKTQANQLGQYLKNNSIDLPDAAFTLGMGRKHFQYRHYSTCSNSDDAIQALKKSNFSINRANKNNRIIFMFPGQGAQYVHMAEELYLLEPAFKEYVDRCSEILIDSLHLDIRDIIYPKDDNGKYPAQEFTQTNITQPAIFVISYSLAKLWMSWGVYPDALLGHSVGEFVAACLAGVISLEDALCLVAKRGELMQQLPKGKMVAIARSVDELEPYLNTQISLSALNAPNLCVLSGSEIAVEKLCEQFECKEIPYQVLQTSHAFHSHMMEPILDEFATLSKAVFLGNPKIPMLSTVTGDWIQNGEITDTSYWSSNLRKPVLFSSAVQKVAFDQETILLEVGPGRTLTALTKMHAKKNKPIRVFASISGTSASHSDLDSLYKTLGSLWSSGVNVDWSKFYQHGKYTRIPLPTYPFERQKYWLDVKPVMPLSPHQQNTLVKNENISEWFYTPSWKKATFLAHDFLLKMKKQHWLIFVDECGLGQSVVDRLNRLKQKVVAIHAGESFKKLSNAQWQINPLLRNDYETLRDELKDRKFFPQQILYLWTVSGFEEPKQNGSLKKYKHSPGFNSMIYLAQILGKETLPEEIVLSVISNNMQHVTGEELICPEKAPILGPLKVIPQEYPDVRCLHIDIEYPDKEMLPIEELINHLLAESFMNFSDPTVAYRGKHRWLQSYETVKIEKKPKRLSKIRQNGVYLITGGMGGIGLVLAEHLGKRYQARLILTGRSSFPEKEQWSECLSNKNTDKNVKSKIKKLLKIEAAGADVHIISADICKQRKMKSQLAKVVQKTGPIQGVIHAAGLPGEGIIQLKDLETAEEILAPKITGTQVLNEILPFEKLDFVVLCSSVASLLGGIGLVDYSAANAYLDAFAVAASSQRKHRVISINWDMWGEVGMGLTTKMPDELQYWLEKELRDGITSKEGIEVFERILANDGMSNIVVSTRDLGARIDLWIRREFVKNKKASLEKTSSRPRYYRPQMKEDFVAPKSGMEASMAEIWGQLFGIEEIGRDDNFYELGGHSLLAASLVNKLKKEFETSISIRDVMDHPTVKELSERLLESIEDK